ncbi:protein disulfide-isomerase-like [Bidens hawaiensis]|uniref:protein disulfide-isomerase-like n=1 Tax=Bidens hawaiensis TaxID=980011 RepID=UPI004049589A
MELRICHKSQLIFNAVTILSLLISSVSSNTNAGAINHVLTLDHHNFSQAASDNDFLVVQFYAPCEKMHRLMCEYVEKLAPEFEKAASLLSDHDPPIVLAKIDGSADDNKELADQFDVTGYPTIVVLKNGVTGFNYYAGPRKADGIVTTLKRLIRHPSTEIKNVTHAMSLIDGDRISVVGMFPIFSGEAFENFTLVANELMFELWDYDFFHTMDAGSLLPRGDELYITIPSLRFFKPYDELFDESENFQVRDMKDFIIESSIPLVSDKNTPDKIMSWLSQLSAEQVTLYVDFECEDFKSFKFNLQNVAAQYKGKGLWFYLADPRIDHEDVFKYDGLRLDQLPVIFIYNNYGSRYMKSNLKPEDILPWINEYKDGKLKPYLRSQPIPETNNEPLKVVVADSLQDMVLNSQKNVLLDIDVPSCGRFRDFAPFIPEVAVFFVDDDDIMVARLDGTTNDIPKDIFDISDCDTLYFRSANGTLISYDGNATKEDIITFIVNNRLKYFLHQLAESVTLDG